MTNTQLIKHYGHTAKEPSTIKEVVDDRGTIVTFKAVKPLEAQLGPSTPFPIDTLPPVFRDYARAVADNLNVSNAMTGTTALGVLSAATQGTVQIEVRDGWQESTCFYSMTVASPGERKSPMLKKMIEPIQAFEKEVNDRREEENGKNATRRTVLEKRERHLTDKAAKSGSEDDFNALEETKVKLKALEEKKICQLIMGNTTTEALIDALVENQNRAAVFAAEGGILDVMGGMYDKTGNIDPYLQGYNQENIIINRKKGKSRIEEPYVTLTLSVQPEVAKGFETNALFVNKGLTGRMVTVYPESQVGYRDDRNAPAIPKAIKAAYNEAVTALYTRNLATEPGDYRILRLDDDARELLDDYKEALEQALRKRLAPIEFFAAKSDALAVRIAGNLHMGEYGFAKESDIPVEISGETMERAIVLTRYFMAEKLRIFEYARGDEQMIKAEYVRDRFIKSGEHSLTRSELSQYCRGKIPKVSEIDTYLNQLVAHGHLAYYNGIMQDGRAQQRLALHPDFWKTA